MELLYEKILEYLMSEGCYNSSLFHVSDYYINFDRSKYMIIYQQIRVMDQFFIKIKVYKTVILPV